MTPPVTVWVLNLDAEIELQRVQTWLTAGRSLDTFSYTTAKPTQHLIDSYAQRFASLLPTNAVVQVGEARIPAKFQGSPGLCWCPTPSALARLRRNGTRPIVCATPQVLIEVNHRRFCAALGQTLPDAQFVETVDEMNALLSRPSPTGEWLCKRPLGFAGRGQRRIAAEEGVRLHSREDNLRWLMESVPQGGLQIEPHVSIVAEFSLHGLVRRNGRHSLGQVCQQQVDEHRAWSGATAVLSYPLSTAQRQQLQDETERVAVALTSAGYFGPFSVDSYVWQAAVGEQRLNPRSEINARMTMAYPVGMGSQWLEDLLLVGSD